MIEAKELRVGNWVNYSGDIIQIKLINGHSDYDDYTPIPLTEEILIRAGLEQKRGYLEISVGRDLYPDYGFEITTDYNEEGDYTLQLWVNGEFRIMKDIKYLHTLQNVWHSLTKKELTIKPITP